MATDGHTASMTSDYYTQVIHDSSCPEQHAQVLAPVGSHATPKALQVYKTGSDNNPHLCSSIQIALCCPGDSAVQACTSFVIFVMASEQSFRAGVGPSEA